MQARAPKSSPGCGLCPKAPTDDSAPQVPGPPRRPCCPAGRGVSADLCAPGPALFSVLLVGVSAGSVPPRVPCTSQFPSAWPGSVRAPPWCSDPRTAGPRCRREPGPGRVFGCSATLCSAAPHLLWPGCPTAQRGPPVPRGGAACPRWAPGGRVVASLAGGQVPRVTVLCPELRKRAAAVTLTPRPPCCCQGTS